MPKPYQFRVILRVLFENGFLIVSQQGSHVKLRKLFTGKMWTVIVPAHGKDVPYGTFRSILRQSGLKEEDFK